MLETKMLKDIDAVIFDMDGTLVDSMWIWPSIDRDFYAKYGLTAPESFPDDMEGMSFTEVAQFFLDSFPTLSHTREEIMEEWTEMAHERYISQAPLKEGVYDFIVEMKRGHKKTVVTALVCRWRGLLRKPAKAESLPNMKPATQLYLPSYFKNRTLKGPAWLALSLKN